MLRLAARDGNISLVERQASPLPVISFCVLLDKRIQRLAQRREPQAEINQFGILQPDVLFEVRDIALQAQRFELAMRRDQQRSARSLIACRAT